jgi:hypothetical protein
MVVDPTMEEGIVVVVVVAPGTAAATGVAEYWFSMVSECMCNRGAERGGRVE